MDVSPDIIFHFTSNAAPWLRLSSDRPGRARCSETERRNCRTPAVTGTQVRQGPVKVLKGYRTAPMETHSAFCSGRINWECLHRRPEPCQSRRGHHQRALWANIFTLRKHFRCPGIKGLLCLSFSCLMAVIRFLLPWFLSRSQTWAASQR